MLLAYLMRILMMIMITNEEEECNDERMDKTNPDPKRHIRWMWMFGIGWYFLFNRCYLTFIKESSEILN